MPKRNNRKVGEESGFCKWLPNCRKKIKLTRRDHVTKVELFCLLLQQGKKTRQKLRAQLFLAGLQVPLALASQPQFWLVEASALNLILGLAIGKTKSIGREIAIGFSRSLCEKWWQACQGVVQSMPAPKYFLPWDNLSMKQNNRGLIGGRYLILWHRSYYYKLPRLCISCRRRYSQILSETTFRPLVFLLWCPFIPAVIQKKTLWILHLFDSSNL